MPLPIFTAIADIRAAVTGKRVALVPTMGALHAGHAALIRAAAGEAEFVVVSVFVNPSQFGPTEDFAKYPRTMDADRVLCAEAGAHAIFAPKAEEMYPPGTVVFVEVPQLDTVLCGRSRPGHFRGVCTVVLKLFNIVQPEVAIFGAKDAQQSIILRKMVKDLNVPVRMQIEPTVREADGLALSSRNRYLSPDERAVAPRIRQALATIESLVDRGEKDVTLLESSLRVALTAIPGIRLDYAEIRDAENLSPMERLNRPALAAVAVFLGSTRLIDNVIL